MRRRRTGTSKSTISASWRFGCTDEIRPTLDAPGPLRRARTVCWRRNRGSCRSPARELHRLEENIGSAAVNLTTRDLAQIERAVAGITVQGARYPEQLQRRVGR